MSAIYCDFNTENMLIENNEGSLCARSGLAFNVGVKNSIVRNNNFHDNRTYAFDTKSTTEKPTLNNTITGNTFSAKGTAKLFNHQTANIGTINSNKYIFPVSRVMPFILAGRSYTFLTWKTASRQDVGSTLSNYLQ